MITRPTGIRRHCLHEHLTLINQYYKIWFDTLFWKENRLKKITLNVCCSFMVVELCSSGALGILSSWSVWKRATVTMLAMMWVCCQWGLISGQYQIIICPSIHSLFGWKVHLFIIFFMMEEFFQNNMVIIYDHGICIYPFGIYHSKIMPTHLNQYIYRGLEVNILMQRRVICILRNIIKHSKDLQSNKVWQAKQNKTTI